MNIIFFLLKATNSTLLQRIGQITCLTNKIYYIWHPEEHMGLRQHINRLHWYISIMPSYHTLKGLARGTRNLLPTWFVYIASKALLNSIACSCFLESLNSTPSALVNFTFFLESKTFWSWQRKVHPSLIAISDFNSFKDPRPYSTFI